MSRALPQPTACLLVALSTIVAALGCIDRQIEGTFSNDYTCYGHVDVTALGAGRYRATGCGRTAVYSCVEDDYEMVCVQEGATRETSVLDEMHDSRRPSSRSARWDTASRETEDGSSKLKVEIILGQSAVLRLRAVSGKPDQAVQMKLTYDGDLTQCQLSWMVNGTRQETEGTFKLGRYSTAKIELSRAMMADLGIARQMAFKACDKRWSLTDEQLYEVHRFASMYEEELAWGGPAGKGAAAGRLAPTGGWPKWNVTGSPPTAVTLDKALDGEALFKLLAPSVVTIENFHGKDEALGSGVAISSTEILTNCHVVEGARKIVAKQDKKEWVAKVSRSDPASDRCVLFVPEGNFKPVPGVRTYGDLRVGEALYTLGSPNGLELTLSSGILSGLRELKGRSYVQTTAPISPGSSGGGLFDAYGNVVGITTFVQVDRDRVNQSLNFAIPADSYWQP